MRDLVWPYARLQLMTIEEGYRARSFGWGLDSPIDFIFTTGNVVDAWWDKEQHDSPSVRCCELNLIRGRLPRARLKAPRLPGPARVPAERARAKS